MWEVARASYDVTVIDVGACIEHDEDLAYDTVAPRRNGAAIAAIGTADAVVAVASADPVGVARLLRSLDDLPTATVPTTVLNRVRRGVVGGSLVAGRGDPARPIVELLRREARLTDVVAVPDDVPTADGALLAGRTWAEQSSRSPARLAVRELAQRFAGSFDAHPMRRRPRRIRLTGRAAT